MKKFVLIDGNAILHRAYHAMPGFTNPRGEPVGAVYGFFAMFLMILQDQKPDYLCVCFDRSKPTVRQTMFAGYHAHRPEMASDLAGQIVLVDELLGVLSVPIFALDGYEADDLIGTIATKVISTKQKAKSTQEIEVIIVTGDRDMLQLVNSHVKVLMPLTGITKTVLMDEATVKDKYGVTPQQFIDYKALIGDQSDGYPGVAGIGPKTAADLLNTYGTFEELYEKVDSLPEKYALKLATDAEQAALAKKLATILTDVPMSDFKLTKCEVSGFDFIKLRAGFEKQSFKSLVVRLEKAYPDLPRAKQMELI